MMEVRIISVSGMLFSTFATWLELSMVMEVNSIVSICVENSKNRAL